MRTQLIVDTSAFRSNLQTIRSLLTPRTKLLAVVKADAYGHGATVLSSIAMQEGVDYLGVATVDEAIELREAGISVPILILTEPTDLSSLPGILYYNLSLTVYSEMFIRSLSKAVETFHKPVKIHVKVDTGMSRVGVAPEEAIPFMDLLKAQPLFHVEGMFTHLATADSEEDSFTLQQLQRFNELKNALSKSEKISLFHVANSAATIRFPEAHYDMVRVGIALYKNVLTFKTRVLFVRDIPSGTSVGYSRTFIADKPLRLAVLSVGYADGYSRLLSNKGEVLLHGKRCPIIGNVCMDMTMVKLPEGLIVSPGDTATLIGTQSGETITAQDVAALTQTIDYEVMCSIGKRVPRVYV